MTELGLDYETYGDDPQTADLVKHGLDAHSRRAEALMVAYRIDRGPLRHVDLMCDSVPAELRDALLDPHVHKWAFNAQFERVITRRVLKIATPVKGWRCAMVLSYMLSFTGGLDSVGAQMGLGDKVRKDADGRRLIRLFSMPQRVTKNQPHRRITPDMRPDEWAKFIAYNKQDVIAEEAIRTWAEKYVRQNSRRDWEWHLYELDQRINDRGKPVDLDFARNALAMAERRRDEIKAEMVKLTGLNNPNSTAQFLPWLRERGYPFTDVQKDTVKKVLAGAMEEAQFVFAGEPEGHYVLDDDAIKALKMRQWAARTSWKKHVALLGAADPEKRVMRFLYQFAGASRTNRWAGRKVQTQNLPRTPKVIEAEDKLTLTTEIIRSGDYDALELWIAEPMEALVGTVRSVFRVEDGYEFVVSDLASIETCVIAWLFDVVQLLEVIRSGKDPYKWFATLLYRIAYEIVTKDQRGICKPPMLGAGYRLGGGDLKGGKKTGLWGYAEAMGVNMTRDQAHEAVQVYRDNLTEIVQGWYALEDAAAEAVTTGRTVRCGKLTFRCYGEFLLMELPSGRPIYYHRPRMVQRFWEDGSPRRKLSSTYMGEEQKTGKWVRLENHGGRFVEQAVQGIARDVLAEGIKAANRKGFDIRGHVHDEIITVRVKGDAARSLDALREAMTLPLQWAPGLPLGAAGWVGEFYRKD